jgi:hypothetical protein
LVATEQTPVPSGVVLMATEQTPVPSGVALVATERTSRTAQKFFL